MKRTINTAFKTTIIAAFTIFFSGCDRYFKNDKEDNSPTSGELVIYCDEGLTPRASSQIFSFQSDYPNAHIELISGTEDRAVEALYNDSCKLILISRLLTDKEKKAFASKDLNPKYTEIAKTGVALITNINTPVKMLSYDQVIELLTKPFVCKDSISNETKLNILFDHNNSSLMHYLKDSILKGGSFSPSGGVLKSTEEAINFVAQHKNTIAFIDFAWLSDVDDSIYKANREKIKFIAVAKPSSNDTLIYEYPSQSSFKLGTYPFTRSIYMMRRGAEFSLAKGFNSFLASPKGQTIFLKEGLLPARQQERTININTNSLSKE